MLVFCGFVVLSPLLVVAFAVGAIVPASRLLERPERPFRPRLRHWMALIALLALDLSWNSPGLPSRPAPGAALAFLCDAGFLVVTLAVGMIRPLDAPRRLWPRGESDRRGTRSVRGGIPTRNVGTSDRTSHLADPYFTVPCPAAPWATGSQRSSVRRDARRPDSVGFQIPTSSPSGWGAGSIRPGIATAGG
jgi:hypothetical protein